MPFAPVWMQIAAWFCTLLVEAGSMAWLARPLAATSPRRAVLWALGVNLVSHPLFWLGHTRLLAGTGQAGLLGAEAGVVLVEALCYGAGLRLSWPRSLGLSVVLNLASFSTGLALWAWLR